MPRRIRLTDHDEAFYHITTRVVDKVFRFSPEENERNVGLLRRVEAFSGVQVVAYCFMSNHIHLLLRVPRRENLTEKELLERIRILYGEKYATTLRNQWSICRDLHPELVEREQISYLRRMYDMGQFMKTLKQRLSISYNARHDREGTLWEDRYHSILLEPTEKVLSAVAAYIDLNPVRAGMVSDPAEYAYSSYGEASRGSEQARASLCVLYRSHDVLPSWEKVAPVYRQRLILKAHATKKRARISLRDIQRALQGRGKLSISSLLRAKSRFLTTGFALGCVDFLKFAKKLQSVLGKPTIMPPLRE